MSQGKSLGNFLKVALVCSLLALGTITFLGNVTLVSPGVVNAQSSPASNGTLKMTFAGTLTTLNPFGATWPDWWVIQLEYAFFGALNPNGSVNPQQSLVNSYSSNSNYTVWNFNVRPGAKWSDGVPINASDLIYTLGVALQPANYPFSWAPNVVSMTARNASDMQVVLNSSTAQFGTYLMSQTTWPVLPYHIWKNENVSSFRNFGTDVVDGPYYVSNYQSGQGTITMLANPYYWGGVPAIKTLQIALTTASSSAPLLLKTGAADVGQIATSDVGAFSSTPSIKLIKESYQYPTLLLWNSSSVPFNNLNFRLALAHMVNYTAIVDEGWNGFASPGGASAYPPGNYYTNPSLQPYVNSMSEATQLLKSAGYTLSGGKWYQPNGQPLTLTIITDGPNSNDVLSAEALSLTLTSAGIPTTYQTVQVPTLKQDLHAGPMGNQMVLYTWTGGFYPVPVFALAPKVPPSATFAVTQPYWMGTPQATALYDQTYGTMSQYSTPANVRPYAYQLENLTNVYVPYLTLDYPQTIWAYNSTFTGWPTNGYFDIGSGVLNWTALATIHAPQTQTITLTSTTSQSTSGSGIAGSYGLLTAAVVVLLIAAVSTTYVYSRRRRAKASEGPKAA